MSDCTVDSDYECVPDGWPDDYRDEYSSEDFEYYSGSDFDEEESRDEYYMSFSFLYSMGGGANVQRVISQRIMLEMHYFQDALQGNPCANDLLNAARQRASESRRWIKTAEDFRSHALPGTADADLAETLASQAYDAQSDFLTWLAAIQVVCRETTNWGKGSMAYKFDVEDQLRGEFIRDV